MNVRVRPILHSRREAPLAPQRSLPFFSLIAGMLILALTGPAAAQDAPDELPEHAVIKPMNGARLLADSSRVDDFGQLDVQYRLDGRTSFICVFTVSS